MLDTWGQILTLCLALTAINVVTIKHNNLLIAAGAAISWLVLLAYNLNHPPTNVIQGDIVHTWMTYGFAIMAIAVIFMWVRNRNKNIEITADGKRIAKISEDNDGNYRTTLMSMSSDDYKNYIRSKVRTKRG